MKATLEIKEIKNEVVTNSTCELMVPFPVGDLPEQACPAGA